MPNPLLDESLRLAGRLADRGDYADAATAMAPWLDAGPPPTPFERTILAYNLATMAAQQGQVVAALAWFDHGIADERPLRRTLCAEGKAALLHAQHRDDEAVALWMDLLAGDAADAEARARIEANLATVLRRG